MLPIGSMWRIGFRLIRPASRAVVSPNFRADQACADSWNEIANRMTASWIAKSTTLKERSNRADYNRRRSPPAAVGRQVLQPDRPADRPHVLDGLRPPRLLLSRPRKFPAEVAQVGVGHAAGAAAGAGGLDPRLPL